MGRSRGVDFNDTTLETWKREIPPRAYKIRTHEKEIVLFDRVKILYGGLDNVQDVSKFASAELGMFFLDQAEETLRNDLADLRGCLRLKISGEVLPYKELYTANPAQCWLKEDFVDRRMSGYAFVPALPADNPHLPPDYFERIREAYRFRPELIEAYLYGSWDILAGADIVIREQWVRLAREVEKKYDQPRRVFGVDVARFGDDSTVVYFLEGTDIKDEMVFGQKDTMYTAGKIAIWVHKYDPDLIGVDTVGLGAGVADRLREMGHPVLDVDSARKADDYGKYRNLRSEMWHLAGEEFSEGEIRLTHDDPELIRELVSPTYEIVRGRIQVEGKEEIKKRLNRSPDKADAYIIGLHTHRTALKQAISRRHVVMADDYVRTHAQKYAGL